MILTQRHGTEMLIQVTVLISILGLIQTSGAANNLSPSSDLIVHSVGVDDKKLKAGVLVKGEDLHAKLAKVMMWDPDHGVWAIRLGSTGQVVGAKAEKLRKLHKVQLEDLHQEEWTRVPKEGLEAQLLSFPKGVEIKIDLSTGEKLVRRGV